uniref:Uncharacterized protein n=1 Tax=Arundo donax TaxID=35708 RepID=A0A0A8XVU4_ARUDO
MSPMAYLLASNSYKHECNLKKEMQPKFQADLFC